MDIDHTMNVGTPEYSAPEISLTKNYDEKVDIYSLGMIIYFIETGRNPYDFPKDSDWLESFPIDKKHSLWFHPTVMSVLLKRIILDCINPDPQKRPTLEYLSSTRIFPSALYDFSGYWTNNSPSDETFTKAFIDDYKSIASILIFVLLSEKGYVDIEFAIDPYSQYDLQLKMLLNGYFFFAIDIIKQSKYAIDDIDLLYAFSHLNQNEIFLYNRNKIAADQYDMLICSLNSALGDFQNWEFFINNYKKVISSNQDIETIPLLYIFSDREPIVSYLEIYEHTSEKFLIGKEVAKNQLEYAYYSLKYYGITEYIDKYVTMDIYDKADALKNLSIHSTDNSVKFRIIGFLMNENCSQSFDFNELLSLIPKDEGWGSFLGLCVLFVAFLVSNDEKYLQLLLTQYTNILNANPKNQNLAMMISRNNANTVIDSFFQNKCIQQIVDATNNSIVILKDKGNYVGFKSLNGSPVTMNQASYDSQTIHKRENAINALKLFFMYTMNEKINMLNDAHIMEGYKCWNQFYNIKYETDVQSVFPRSHRVDFGVPFNL